jgi:hypothetical protein
MRPTALLCAFVAALLSAPQATAPQALGPEMSRIRAEIASAPKDDQRDALLNRLDRARAARDAGRTLLALYLFESPWENARSGAFVQASSAVTTQDGFDRKWAAMGEPHPITARGGRRPLLVEALAAAAEARASTTYQASRQYAADSSLDGGLFYLGQSHAVVQFAAFARSLEWPVTAPAPPLHSIAAELSALDAEMTTAYEKMERANHPTYIQASAALKQANTLNDRGQYAGAIFEYLLATYLFSPLRPAAASREATAAQITEARQALPPGLDHSIAELFLELAEEGTASSTPAQRIGSGAVVDAVLPAYLRAIARDTKSTTAPAAADVIITLVRWPFT